MSVIRIKDNKETLEIRFADIRKYHGSLALMAVAVGFRSLQAAFGELFGTGEAPQRKSISVLSGHAGPGFRDAFEFVTRAVTRGAYTVDTAYPQGQYDPHRPQSYAFVISTDDGSAVEVVLQENFLPSVFYDYLKKGREQTFTEADIAAFDELKLSLSERALALPAEELLYVRRIR
ncbi:hypothetical protein PAESOLCIP111_01828 [Paenibacillus solanacearum]|uniref:Formylmethanofuran dehydrogenase subunit E domain-containing protein n=1 Tax=Paenibacillus solanacearum TaxID=2048548 RepID=A0A916NHQ3_9BACL|nr:hypothetical protein [Paenibacillus solanacearum]CAG7615803.1 hypothetical protein PAESOLCIP111_01828 [Paenibacillus solanacearum]